MSKRAMPYWCNVQATDLRLCLSFCTSVADEECVLHEQPTLAACMQAWGQSARDPGQDQVMSPIIVLTLSARRQTFGIAPSVSTYATLLKAYAQNYQWEQSISVLAFMCRFVARTSELHVCL